MWLEAGPLLLLTPIFFLFPSPPRLKIIAAWSLLGFVFRYLWIGESALLFRYILPAYSAWLILGAAAWQSRLFENKWAKRTASAVVILGLVFPGIAMGALRVIPELRLNAGTVSGSAYLNAFYPSEGWGMVETVNALPEGSKVAVLDHHFMPYHYKNLAGALWPVPGDIMNLDEPAEIRAELKKRGITHVLLVAAQWSPVRSKDGIVLAAVFMGPYVTCRWWETGPNLSFLKPVYKSSGAVLYEVN